MKNKAFIPERELLLLNHTWWFLVHIFGCVHLQRMPSLQSEHWWLPEAHATNYKIKVATLLFSTKCDPGPQNQSHSQESVFRNWDLYIIWKLNKQSLHWCMVCYDRTRFVWDTTIWKFVIWGYKKNLHIEKIIFKVVQMKFLAMHITNLKLRFDIFTVGNLQNIFMEHDLYLIS